MSTEAGRSSPAPHIHGRFEAGFAWMVDPGEFMQRSSTALLHDGRVWLVDPLRAPGIEGAIAELGPVAGVILTTWWHDRDAAWFANLHGVPLYVARRLGPVHFDARVETVEDSVPGTPFRFVDCSLGGALSWWRETPLWWPERQTLVTGDCLGAASYFAPPGQRVAVHPLMRMSPPFALAPLGADRLYCGHGRGIDRGASAHILHALETARRGLPRAWLNAARATVRHFRP